MNEPKLKRTTVEISFSCRDGYSKRTKFLSRAKPEQGMLGAIRELSRMAHLYGFGDEALATFNEARDAVAEFKRKHN